MAQNERHTSSIRVVTIEDDPQYRSSLELLFRRTGDFELVASFGSPAAALAALDGADAQPVSAAQPDGGGGTAPARQSDSGRGTASAGQPDGGGAVSGTAGAAAAGWDLVLMDIDLPGMNGIACTRQIKQRRPNTAVVVLTVFEERATIVEAICAGADGYLLKRTTAAELLSQLRAIAQGGAPISAGVARTVLDLVRRLGPPVPGNGAARAGSFELTERELDVLRCLVQGMSYKRTAQQLDISLDTVRSHIRSVYSKLQVHSVAEAVSRALREGIV
ncbi:MAG TPA: response regulator transcription factor [Longimicrobiales bacterium]|nr:response regulator transcription factor [Longimicrobiales bacterium]